MTDNLAVLRGYTDSIVATGADHELHLLVKPGTDLDDAFVAYDTDTQKFLRVNGWMFVIEPEQQGGSTSASTSY